MEIPVSDKLVWIDCEMTGLDYNEQCLVEIAVIITDGDLSNPIEGPEIVIHQPESVLARMEKWPKRAFAKNGLMQQIRASKISLKEAEDEVLKFVEAHTPKGTTQLAGSTIYMDYLFLMKDMPRLAAHFDTNFVDVSCIKELTKRWNPEVFADAPRKRMPHRALEDIRESINELKYYRTHIFGHND